MMPVYYLGWIMRLYVDFGQLNQFRHREIKDELCEIACIYPNFDICDVRNLPGTPVEDASNIFAKNWRFFPTLDPQVKNSNEFRLGSVCKVVMGQALKIRVRAEPGPGLSSSRAQALTPSIHFHLISNLPSFF